ncbi:MAG: cyclic pyranopterin monophosphate synthase MoaC [Candidatus Hodarchaeales archaeon]|jgi:cyclic pyranopterin phosphate synthase
MSIDITEKEIVKRVSTAKGTIHLSKGTISKILSKNVQKGDPLENARYAAIHAVKKTPELVFMAHPIPIEGVETDFTINEDDGTINATVSVYTTAKTGVEIEALAGVMNSLLAIFDMVKMYEKDSTGNYPDSSRIDNVYVVMKSKKQV